MSRTPVLLDTSAVIGVLRGRPPGARERIHRARASGRPIALSSVTMFELWYGVAKGVQADQNTRRLHDFLDVGVEIVTFGEEDAEIAGALRAHLERAGTPIGPYDLLIAAHARRLGCTLVTENVGEFSRVPGLTVENWSLPE